MNRNNNYYYIFMDGYDDWDFTGRMRIYNNSNIKLEITYTEFWSKMGLTDLIRNLWRKYKGLPKIRHTTFLPDVCFIRNNTYIEVSCAN